MLNFIIFSKIYLSVNCPVGELGVGELGVGELSFGEPTRTLKNLFKCLILLFVSYLNQISGVLNNFLGSRIYYHLIAI
jgi:hypothetical protein